MAAKSTTFAGDILKLVFNGTAITGLARDAAVPLTSLHVALHSAVVVPGDDQTTSEVAYTSYARVAVARDNTGWAVTGNSVSPVDDIEFPEASGALDDDEATHWSIGTAASGAGKVLYAGVLSPPVAIALGVTPIIKDTSTGTES